MSVVSRLESLRKAMISKSIAAYIIPSSDPHLSEYISNHYKTREWLSGFTGSAGTLVVTQNEAALWTDSRYFIQAETELKGTGISLCKMGLPETPTIETWLSLILQKKALVAFNGRLMPYSLAKATIQKLKDAKLKVDSNIDLIPDIWKNRPVLPSGKAFTHELRFAGATVEEKIEAIRIELLKNHANGCVITTLDDVAWTFNIRGNDVDYNPVVMAYGYVSMDDAVLFIDSNKISDTIVESLQNEGVAVLPYSKAAKFFGKLGKKETIALDGNRTNFTIYNSICKRNVVHECISIPTQLKAKKNSVELENIRGAMVSDGVALVKFFTWFEQSLGNEKIDEVSLGKKLFEFRSKQPNFVSESFSIIVGYADHGAIVHYSATPETAYEIKPKGFLLIDSGGQYHSGTTDITRTLHLSSPTKEEATDYTLVLKGMIQLSLAKFPTGTRGVQLDVLARNAMWREGVNYGHGTGHGVGAFLNVHEGPQSIRQNENPVTLELGMVQSNEPAIYRAGKYGIRIENLIACVPAYDNEFGKFYQFETLTLCPIDTNPIRVEMLTTDEIDWINSYHKMVYEKLSGKLTKKERDWLKAKTKEI